MRVTVLGLGYVGCVTAACLARDGDEVIGVAINVDKVAMALARQLARATELVGVGVER